MRLRVGELEPAGAQESLAEPGAAPDLDGVRVGTEVALHPGEPLAERESEVRAAAPVVLGARARDVAGVTHDHARISAALFRRYFPFVRDHVDPCLPRGEEDLLAGRVREEEGIA